MINATPSGIGEHLVSKGNLNMVKLTPNSSLSKFKKKSESCMLPKSGGKFKGFHHGEIPDHCNTSDVNELIKIADTLLESFREITELSEL